MEALKNYCAFLRGVNVNGRNMKMADVCSVFSQAGMKEVSSVLATGNILFHSDQSADELRLMLQRAMTHEYSYPVDLFLKTADEVRAIVKSCPFAPEQNLHIYSFICQAGVEALLLHEFEKTAPMPRELAAINNRLFYWQVEKGFTLSAGFSKILARKDMQSLFTSRNLNTIVKIMGKMGE